MDDEFIVTLYSVKVWLATSFAHIPFLQPFCAFAPLLLFALIQSSV